MGRRRVEQARAGDAQAPRSRTCPQVDGLANAESPHRRESEAKGRVGHEAGEHHPKKLFADSQVNQVDSKSRNKDNSHAEHHKHRVDAAHRTHEIARVDHEAYDKRGHEYDKRRGGTGLGKAVIGHGGTGDAARKTSGDGDERGCQHKAHEGTHARGPAAGMLSSHEKLVSRKGVVSGHDVEQRAYQRQCRDEKRLPGKRDAASHKEEKRRDHEGDGAGGKHLATTERTVHLACLKRQNRGADTSEQGAQPKQRNIRSHGSKSDEKAAEHTQAAHGNNKEAA